MPGWARWLLAVLVAAAVVAALAIGGAMAALQWWAGLFEPVNTADPRPVRVRISAGVTTREVATMLEEQGLIRSALAFRFYAREQSLDGRLQPGTYEIARSYGIARILDDITRGRRILERVMVPEGATVAEVAQAVAARGLAGAAEIEALARDRSLVADLVPAGLALPLEGYLFPATYQFEPEAGAKAIVKAMVERFRQAITPAVVEQAKQKGLSVHQLVTLASIIEGEAQLPAEREVIAGVYWNRLEVDMRLEADPTVAFALGKPRGAPLTAADVQTDHPYNTYRRSGLPPGPIASPGEAAIRAVLAPASHKYLFFVAKGDGSGAHRFSVTLAEHEEAIELAEAEAAARKR